MDRCALFVDAGYVLADGAMTVHGTRRRQSVSWDYGGLLQLLSNLAMERTGLPLLRCYWYDAAAGERRSAEQEALADMPGVKLRLAGADPGGVAGEMRRDLTTLARNQAVGDVMVVSSAEELTRVVADVQDLGMRVTLLHLAADGNRAISRTLRQECDDVIEISPAHLRPYVELIPGAEPPRADERDAPRPYTNGHVPGGQTTGYTPMPPESANGHAIPADPAPADYQRPVPRLAPPAAQGDPEPPAPAAPAAFTQPPAPEVPAPEAPPAPAPAPASVQPPEPAVPPEPTVAAEPPAAAGPGSGDDLLAGLAAMPVTASQRDAGAAFAEPSFAPREPGPAAPPRAEPEPAAAPPRAETEPAPPREPVSGPVQPAPAVELPAHREFAAYQDLFAAPVTEVPPSRPPALPSSTSPEPEPEPVSAEPAPPVPALPEPVPQPLVSQPPAPPEPAPEPVPQPTASAPEPAASRARRDEDTASFPVPRPYPADLSGYTPGALRDPFLTETGSDGSTSGPQPAISVQETAPVQEEGTGHGQHVEYAPSGHGQANGSAGLRTAGFFGTDPLGAPGPATPAPAGTPVPADPAVAVSQSTISLTDAVQSAHEEGQEFGGSVARDAPTLWLEAVLARKPRMPSDLEARLLQGSSLPIDFLLHDEVRHALRRGFWDALERARR